MILYVISKTKKCANINFEFRERRLFFFRKHFFTSSKNYLKIGIIGSGPSALYCCKYFLKNGKIKIDLFDKLPNPYGLIRYGIAPDHVQVKNIFKTFNSVVLSDSCRFFGNVNVGIDIKIEELRNYYNILLFCCGASEPALPDSQLLLKSQSKVVQGNDDIYIDRCSVWCDDGSDGRLNGVAPFHAGDLIRFYNGYYNDLRCRDIDNYLNSFSNFTSSVIIGNGNVSLDVARVLLKSPEELDKTDINGDYLNAIKRHKIKHIYIVGRRGFWQSSFTNAELRELFSLHDTKVILNKRNYDLCFHLNNYDHYAPSKMKERQNKLFQNMVQNYEELEKNKNLYEKYKILEFIFYYEMKKIHPINNHMNAVAFEINKDIGLCDPTYPKEKIFTTPLLIYATGFKKNIFCENLYNQSIHNFKDDMLKKKFGIFRAGWFETGPKGNIATQVANSKNATTRILNFLHNTTTYFDNDIIDLLNQKKIKFVTFDDWAYIQNAEEKMGAQQGKTAQKMATVEALLRALDDRKGKANPN
ncbi:adrenodoxin reductase, putative [Plasmodium ovale]|uniref:Adrenodoxin reductase, putative n=2 Tax=Plasmodium ovale TaxID=36330 RepID=A0A1A8WA93_PLAOA|nr:adrenodoxin reductase, putative [Plasmodium ovale curtisi]SBS91960.1 adrenodoxin reductase, putative [Plasmodium ovale curtisi]SCP04722.1 adrenodoxin reductase, putative [Plasmodium ovale]